MKYIYAIETKKITKKFSNTIANDNISFKVKKGTIHAIVGENGAGKSTLMNQLFGLLMPTSGEIHINGKRVNISNPNVANEFGLSMVHQHFQLVQNHSILENIILGDEKSKSLMPIDYRRASQKLLNISKKYNLQIDPNAIVKKVSVGMQQRIEIMKMLYRGADILIFDEPTAMLIPQEIEGLLKLFLDLKKKGKTIIFISHKLQEVKNVAEEATVIRKGKVVGSVKVKTTSIEKMAELMVGRKLVHVKNNNDIKFGRNLLSIKNLSVKHHSNPKILGLKNFSIDVKEGEILAIAGVEGNGQSELINAIFGLQKWSKGRIELLSKNNEIIDLKNGNIKSRYDNDFSFVPEDRYKYAMLRNETLFTNVILQTFRKRPFQFLGFLRRGPKIELTKNIIKEFDVRGSMGGSTIIGELSGGNQQKFIFGREMTRKHKVIILFQPTRGLDIGAIEFIHKKIIEEKLKGNAVILVSYELNEVMALADRIAVLSQGELIKVSNAKGITKEKIGKWMAGVK